MYHKSKETLSNGRLLHNLWRICKERSRVLLFGRGVGEEPVLFAQTVDAARLRCDPQVLRTRQAGSRQELHRRCRKLLGQCRLDANAQEKNKDGKDFRHCRYNDLKKDYLELTFKSFCFLLIYNFTNKRPFLYFALSEACMCEISPFP